MQIRHDPPAEADSVPEPPNPARPEAEEEVPARPVDPTRYGDWERNGRCIDF